MMERLLPLVNRKRQAAVEVEDNKVIALLCRVFILISNGFQMKLCHNFKEMCVRH